LGAGPRHVSALAARALSGHAPRCCGGVGACSRGGGARRGVSGAAMERARLGIRKRKVTGLKEEMSLGVAPSVESRPGGAVYTPSTFVSTCVPRRAR